jgi:hypothetical protein
MIGKPFQTCRDDHAAAPRAGAPSLSANADPAGAVASPARGCAHAGAQNCPGCFLSGLHSSPPSRLPPRAQRTVEAAP